MECGFNHLYTTLGVFMRDVTLCNYGNPKKLKNGLFNFSKLRILVQMVGYTSSALLIIRPVTHFSLKNYININVLNIIILLMIGFKLFVVNYGPLKIMSK